jgi:hypothetical protein
MGFEASDLAGKPPESTRPATRRDGELDPFGQQ